jgi:Flp pilus assembly protein TadG
MIHRRLGALRRLLACTRGTGLIETAAVAPFLALTIIGTVDLARFGAARLKLQQAVNRGLEMSVMGGTSMSTASIKTQTATQAGVAETAVTVTQALECSGTAKDWTLSCSTGEEEARYTTISISTVFDPTFDLSPTSKVWANSEGMVPISTSGTIRIK